MRSILITGGTGFIGSHTCLTLLENGLELSSWIHLLIVLIWFMRG